MPDENTFHAVTPSPNYDACGAIGGGMAFGSCTHTHLVPVGPGGTAWEDYWSSQEDALPVMWPGFGYTESGMTDVSGYQPRLVTTYQHLVNSPDNVSSEDTDGIIYAGWSGGIDASSGTIVSANPALSPLKTGRSFKRFMVTYIIYYSG